VRSTGSAFGASSSTRPVLDRSLVRLAFLIPGGLALLMGLDAALLLLGLHAPLTLDRLPQLHAPLMVFGFVGTFIVLERAVAARRWWGFAAPGLLGLGSLVMLSPLPVEVGKAMLVVGMAALLGIYFVVWQRQAAAATAIQVLGALSGLSATVLCFNGPLLMVPAERTHGTATEALRSANGFACRTDDAHARHAEPAGRCLHHNGDFSASSGRCARRTRRACAGAVLPCRRAHAQCGRTSEPQALCTSEVAPPCRYVFRPNAVSPCLN